MSRVESFRGKRQRTPLHPAERTLLWILAAHLCFLPWALGTMHPWSQIVSLAFSVLGFAVAVWPRDYTGELSGDGEPFRMLPWLKLRRFPPFWLGLALLCYVGVQGLNPEWLYMQTDKVWWLVRKRDAAWLPTSVESPFAEFNAWRDWIVYASAWLTACAVWVGLARRSSLRLLLWVLTINGVLLCGLEGYQHLTGNFHSPWPLTALTPRDLNGSFIYKNHAGAYFALIAFVAVALATWFFDHGSRTLMKSTPAGVLALAAMFLAGGTLFTLSRGASLILALSLLVFAVWFLLRRKFGPVAEGASPMITGVVVAVFVLFALNTIRYMDFSAIYSRFDAMAVQQGNEDSVHSRLLAHRAASEMLRDHWLRGVGAGGFRYLFPQYVRRYPEIYQGGHLYWEHAHGDWWEIPIELGLAGDLLLLAGAAWWGVWFVRRRVGWHAFAVPLLLGCFQTIVHAGFDFPFQCPAILVTWCVLVTVAGRWAELSAVE